MIFTVCAVGVLAVLLHIGVSDWRYRRISNRDVVFVAIGSALCFLISIPLNISGLFLSLGAALALTIPGFFSGHVGAGDVKLLCALAPLWSAIELLSVFVIGVFLLAPLFFLPRSLRASAPQGRGFPIGTAMALGSLPWFVRKVVLHV